MAKPSRVPHSDEQDEPKPHGLRHEPIRHELHVVARGDSPEHVAPQEDATHAVVPHAEPALVLTHAAAARVFAHAGPARALTHVVPVLV